MGQYPRKKKKERRRSEQEAPCKYVDVGFLVVEIRSKQEAPCNDVEIGVLVKAKQRNKKHTQKT